MKRKIAVILAADIAGYSRLIAEDEEETLRRFEGYRTVFEEFVERGQGRIFNTAGDAILAEFQSAVEAVRCAVDVQESLKARNLAYPPSRHMNFRIGITIGDVVERAEWGPARRRREHRRTPGIRRPARRHLRLRSVHEAVSSKMGLRFADAGPQALKNIPERVHAYTLSLDDAPDTPVAVTKTDPSTAPTPVRAPAAKGQSNWLSIVLALLAVVLAGVYAYKYLPDEVLEKIGLAKEEPLDLDSRPATTVEVKPESVAPPPKAVPDPHPEPATKPAAPEPASDPTPQPEPTRAGIEVAA